ncbi:2-aminoethanethiol (cysteamine) dioxygenase a [Boleophthalmus pectinirostris]|uniref:2-aminoethanethiol (cysteamine) dioxygenase a n=1 Tax=Boleophthalmus pectinirostris TaxID=150288 RepID=UPI000A1C4F23|nr:2-aminoethanethiol (cysteamine) dioxygenase a [Boleophthalmus pectinirostris]
MPRDRTPLIQKIAKQASITFKDCLSKDNGEHKPLPEQHKQLISLVTALRAADLKLAPRKSNRPGPEGAQSPPVTYMHICETPVFSMGVFILRTGTSIPLHDHPGMNGMIKVLYGKVGVRCFDKLDSDGAVPPVFEPPLSHSQVPSLCRSMLHCVSEYSASSPPCLLTPQRDNLHQIEALGGPAAFLDILAPPYDPDNNRDCHYYRVLQVSAPSSESPEETWLLEIPQPEDFWCGGQAYPGPPVSV